MATYFFCNIGLIPSRTQSSQLPKINIKFLREDIGPSTIGAMALVTKYHDLFCNCYFWLYAFYMS